MSDTSLRLIVKYVGGDRLHTILFNDKASFSSGFALPYEGVITQLAGVNPQTQQKICRPLLDDLSISMLGGVEPQSGGFNLIREYIYCAIPLAEVFERITDAQAKKQPFLDLSAETGLDLLKEKIQSVLKPDSP